MKLFGPDRRELMTIGRIEREGGRLMVRAKVFGTMPMTVALAPEDVRAGLKLLGWSGLWFLLTMPLRRSRPDVKQGEGK
jgi:hypothetical protein